MNAHHLAEIEKALQMCGAMVNGSAFMLRGISVRGEDERGAAPVGKSSSTATTI